VEGAEGRGAEMNGKPKLYLLELILAALCVGVSTLVMHRVFDVMEIQAFFVAFVAVAMGLAVFWIYFVPRAALPHQRTLGLVTSLFVGLGLAPWVVEPLTEPIFAARSASTSSIRLDLSRADDKSLGPKILEDLNRKLLDDGFARRDIGNERIYTRRGVVFSVESEYDPFERDKGMTVLGGFSSHLGWSAQGFWFQVDTVEAEGKAYKAGLEAWKRSLNIPY
jgi:hypothetical protein